jgi:hypothetical protein
MITDPVAPAWEAIRHQLEWSQGHWLGWITAMPGQAQSLMARVDKELTQVQVCLRVDEDHGAIRVVDQLVGEAPPQGVLVWVWCASSTPEARRQWIGLHNLLNERRERLERRLPRGLIFVGPPGFWVLARDNAPDLWTMRSLLVEVGAPGLAMFLSPTEAKAMQQMPAFWMGYLRQAERDGSPAGAHMAQAAALLSSGVVEGGDCSNILALLQENINLHGQDATRPKERRALSALRGLLILRGLAAGPTIEQLRALADMAREAPALPEELRVSIAIGLMNSLADLHASEPAIESWCDLILQSNRPGDIHFSQRSMQVGPLLSLASLLETSPPTGNPTTDTRLRWMTELLNHLPPLAAEPPQAQHAIAAAHLIPMQHAIVRGDLVEARRVVRQALCHLPSESAETAGLKALLRSTLSQLGDDGIDSTVQVLQALTSAARQPSLASNERTAMLASALGFVQKAKTIEEHRALAAALAVLVPAHEAELAIEKGGSTAFRILWATAHHNAEEDELARIVLAPLAGDHPALIKVLDDTDLLLGLIVLESKLGLVESALHHGQLALTRALAPFQELTLCLHLFAIWTERDPNGAFALVERSIALFERNTLPESLRDTPRDIALGALSVMALHLSTTPALRQTALDLFSLYARTEEEYEKLASLKDLLATPPDDEEPTPVAAPTP